MESGIKEGPGQNELIDVKNLASSPDALADKIESLKGNSDALKKLGKALTEYFSEAPFDQHKTIRKAIASAREFELEVYHKKINERNKIRGNQTPEESTKEARAYLDRAK